MGSDDVSAAAWFRIARWMLIVTAAASGLGAASAAKIYSCVDGAGKRLTSDRPIAECTAREQRLLNADGSTKKVLPPTMTAEERADAEAREREKAARRAAEVDAIRRDRNLRLRYPNEATHQKARLAALDDLKRTLQLSERRLEALAAEKKPLLEEAEFYVGRAMPTGLKQQLDGIDATVEAQRALILNQQAESQRINATFDTELARLRTLWAGAPPGSLGSTPPTPVSASASAATATLSPASASAAP
jgi:hypothetical protein